MALPKIGLALGSGGARGIAHVHALQAFDDLGIQPAQISGASIGSIFGAAYASGMSAAEIIAFTEERFSNRWKLLADLLQINPRNISGFIEKGGLRFGEIDIERALGLLLPDDFPARFDQLQIPLNIVASDFFAQREQVFNSGDLLPAMAASAAIPAVFSPVTIDGRVYIDGGTTNPVPFDVFSDDIDLIVAIDIIGSKNPQQGSLPRKSTVLPASVFIMQRAICRAKEKLIKPDIVIKPELEGVMVHDFLKVQEVLQSSSGICDALKSRLTSHIN